MESAAPSATRVAAASPGTRTYKFSVTLQRSLSLTTKLEAVVSHGVCFAASSLLSSVHTVSFFQILNNNITCLFVCLIDLGFGALYKFSVILQHSLSLSESAGGGEHHHAHTKHPAHSARCTSTLHTNFVSLFSVPCAAQHTQLAELQC